MKMTIDEIPDIPLVAAWRRDAEFDQCNQTCTEINQFLLNRADEIPEFLTTIISNFDELFKWNSLNKGTILFRGCPRWTVEKGFSADEMIYPAFISASTSIDVARTFRDRMCPSDSPILLQLILADHTPIIDVQSRKFSGIGENEFVLPRDTRLTFVRTLQEGFYEFLVHPPLSGNQESA